MTKAQLLASLKPLEWKTAGYGYIYLELEAGKFLSRSYHILRDDSHRYILSIMNKFYGRFDLIEEAKAAAQEHYNNLVLELFNLEEE